MSDPLIASQRLNDMRVRMLDNVRNNRPVSFGFTVEELREGIEATKRNSFAASTARAKKATAKTAANADAIMAELFPGVTFTKDE
jgi:hypothetical protein